MKKRLISLVAAAALVGGVAVAGAPQVAKAGTVTVKGDTQATLYGFVWANYGWINQMGGDPDSSNMPLPDATSSSSKLYQSTYDETKAYANILTTRLGFTFKNEDANLNGRLEMDFWGGGGGSLRVRRAYVQHNFDNFYLLIGQEWILEEMFSSISAGFTAPAGFDEVILRVPQIRVGTNLDLGSASLDLALALEYEGARAVRSCSTGVNGYTPADVDRVTFTTVAARAVLHLDTGFGAPARLYAWGSIIPVYMTANDNYVDDSETSYAFGAGVKVPVSMFTIGGNFQYSDGATGYAGVTNGLQPASYYANANGDSEDTEMYAWNVNLTVTPIPCITVGGEYDYVEFKNDDVFDGTKPDVKTFVGNINIKTTKYTKLTLEWRHVKAEDFDATGLTYDDDFSGDQVYARYLYTF